MIKFNWVKILGGSIMNKLKKCYLSFMIVPFLLTGCSEPTEEVMNDISEVVTEENEYVQAIKTGSLDSYPDVTVEDVFSSFFSSMEWGFLEANTEGEVVEFTGNCMYKNDEVEVKIQFLITESGEDTHFEIDSLTFNNVLQEQSVIDGLLSKVFEGDMVEEYIEEIESLEIADTVNGITIDEATKLSKRLPSYDDLVASGNTFSKPEIQDGKWSISVMQPDDEVAGTILINENRTVYFMYSNGDIDEVTPYGIIEENIFLSEDEVLAIVRSDPSIGDIESSTIDTDIVYTPTANKPYYIVDVGDLYTGEYTTVTVNAYSGEIVEE